MRFDAGLMLRAALALSAVAMLWIAMAFLAVAIFTVLTPGYGTAAAATLTALVFLVILGLAVLVYFATTRSSAQSALPLQAARTTNATLDSSMTAVLTQLAKDHPLIAVGCATALGIANAMQSDSDRYSRR
jgi:hypothetical protein